MPAELSPFAPEMVRAFKRRGIAVAGADRIVLGDHIAVQDLMSVADFLLLPEDDLALANILKSPLFGLDDEDLLAFAPNRPGLLWSALLKAAEGDERFRPAAEQLKKWRSQADFSPPFEFFANLLDRDGGRARLQRPRRASASARSRSPSNNANCALTLCSPAARAVA